MPAKPAIDSQRRTPLYDSGRREPRADLQQLVESARETENEGLGFGDRSGESSRGSDRRAAALQPVRLPDLNRGAVGRREAARKTSSFFKQPAAAAERFEESAGVAGVRVGLGRMGDDDGNGQELGELKARDESPLEVSAQSGLTRGLVQSIESISQSVLSRLTSDHHHHHHDNDSPLLMLMQQLSVQRNLDQETCSFERFLRSSTVA